MAKKKPDSPFVRAILMNASRRKQRYAKFKAAGAKWMIEWQDLWDLEDGDAGVYFSDYATRAEVDADLKKMDPSAEKVLGIYDLSAPLEPQGPGIPLLKWTSGC